MPDVPNPSLAAIATDNEDDEKDKRVKINVTLPTLRALKCASVVNNEVLLNIVVGTHGLPYIPTAIIEGEDETGEGEMGRKQMKRFQLPNLPRWWQAVIIQYAFSHPHVRARLEKHMGCNLVRLTDKTYMTELEERIRAVNEETLNRRINTRVMDEMERLKRLILVGKTPLKECPPELFHHPVFVFWRMVNREVNRASKKRAEAYFRKLKASQKADLSMADEHVPEEEVAAGEGEQLTPEQLLKKCRADVEEQKQLDLEKGVRFTDEQFAQLKYETQEVKQLKNLTTVEELYALADKIIGTKRL